MFLHVEILAIHNFERHHLLQEFYVQYIHQEIIEVCDLGIPA